MRSRALIEAEVTAADVNAAAKLTDRNPTDSQKKADNYRQGKITIDGLKIAIETPKGAYRSGTDKSGKEWKVKLPAHYGKILGTVGKDKDHVDVWIGPNPASKLVWIVNQRKIDADAFDEHKCMIGFDSKKDAVACYDAAYTGNLGKKIRQSVTATSMEGFKQWLKNGNMNAPFEY